MESTTLIDNYRFLASYNRWFNGRLYAACEQLSDQERKLDRGAFFGSIHGTLNHIVWGDQVWLKRFAVQATSFASLGGNLLELPATAAHATILHPEWAALRAKREQLDAAIEAWVQEMTDAFLSQVMRYTNSSGVRREHPVWQAITHFFNHQTHHRGQVTALLAQAGIDPGVTDMIAML